MFTTKTKKFVAGAMLSATLLGGVVTPVLANENGSIARVSERVQSEISDEIYRRPDGTGATGNALYEIRSGEARVTSEFDTLSESEKQRFLGDINDVALQMQEADAQALEENPNAVTNAVTAGTISDFWELLGRRDTVASRMIAVVNQQFKPDFIGANALLAPFAPIYNVGTAVFLILAAFSFFLHLAIDVFYFQTPWMQYWVTKNDGSEGIKGIGANMVSKRAKDALNNSKDGGNPLVKYIWASWFQMFLYAVVLLFFAANSMLTLVGPLANLVGGFLNF